MVLVVIRMTLGPMICVFFNYNILNINTYYVGNLNDPTLLAGVGMGNTVLNVLAFATQ